jgi:hypothetical protein
MTEDSGSTIIPFKRCGTGSQRVGRQCIGETQSRAIAPKKDGGLPMARSRRRRMPHNASRFRRRLDTYTRAGNLSAPARVIGIFAWNLVVIVTLDSAVGQAVNLVSRWFFHLIGVNPTPIPLATSFQQIDFAAQLWANIRHWVLGPAVGVVISAVIAQGLIGWFGYCAVTRRTEHRLFRFVRWWSVACAWGSFAVILVPFASAIEAIGGVLAGSELFLVGSLPYFALAPATLRRIHAVRRARRWGRCSKCGYNLRGNVSGACPECRHRWERIPRPTRTVE